MSLMESGKVLPLTAVAWTSNTGCCPKDFVLDLKSSVVVSDIQVISDKDTIPHGYSYIREFLDSKTTVSKKKRVVVRTSPVANVETAVLDIKLTAKSKMLLQHYTYVGDIHGYVLWCRKGQFSSPGPKAKPRSISLDVRSLSLEEPSAPALPLRPRDLPPIPQQIRLSNRRHSLQAGDVQNTSADNSLQTITALDGVPFSLHPDFDLQANGTALQLNSQLNNIRIKSVKDIENEYSYTFTVEESAAKRIRPSVST
ncbi:multivesicular body subunit 12A isoform X2 [Gambusia affinis]|uniref:multivesicular body subunit 12A isoform X2 n=1 Tax=Gambusia affinis TaxID=33528 RepID=UPI001CDC3CBF|nr:multivesicular body subunit 12A isoform X2 [Gambusia affinis]